ncbi:MAG: hypothetical protein IKJ94_02600 [Oscillospiraceae bacterium]|nr:hypothetical protein [Oscillospiraceae bacterium]
MKSCEEMTNAVLFRIREEKAAQKRKHKKVLTVALCVCFIGLTAFAGSVAARQTGGDASGKTRVSLFCITANAAEQPQQMHKGGTVPYHAVLRIHDITGLSDQDVQHLRSTDEEYANRMTEGKSENQGGFISSVTSWRTDKILVSTIYAGAFYLTVDDYTQVQDVFVTTTGIGDTAINSVDYYDASLSDGVGITWSLSGEVVDMLEKNPEMKLSQLTDTVTVTVEFNDGTKEIAVIDITVDDAGQIYGTFQGSNVA